MIMKEMFDDAAQGFGDQDIGNPVQPCQTATRLHDVRLLTETRSTWTQIKKASTTTHHVVADVSHAWKDEILDAMRLVEHGDILTWHLHTWFPESEEHKADPVASGIVAGTVLPFHSGDHITTAEFLAALQVGTPPAAVIMCGCATFQFIPAVLGAGVAVAFGVGRDPSNGDPNKPPFPTEYAGLQAADSVTAALMNGKTLADAADDGSNSLNYGRSPMDQLIMYFKVRSGLSQSKSLEDNHLL